MPRSTSLEFSLSFSLFLFDSLANVYKVFMTGWMKKSIPPSFFQWIIRVSNFNTHSNGNIEKALSFFFKLLSHEWKRNEKISRIYGKKRGLFSIRDDISMGAVDCLRLWLGLIRNVKYFSLPGGLLKLYTVNRCLCPLFPTVSEQYQLVKLILHSIYWIQVFYKFNQLVWKHELLFV